MSEEEILQEIEKGKKSSTSSPSKMRRFQTISMDTAYQNRKLKDLFNDEILGDNEEFVDYLAEQLKDFEKGKLKFKYVDNLRVEETQYDQSGNPFYEEGDNAAGLYDIDSRDIYVDSKYKGDIPKTLSILAHELYHKYNSKELNEDIVEFETGKALYKLSKKSGLYKAAFNRWYERQEERGDEYIQKYGADAWKNRIHTLGSELKHRYQGEGGHPHEGEPIDYIFSAIASPIKAVEGFGRTLLDQSAASYMGLRVDTKPSFGEGVQGFLKSVHTAHRHKREQKHRAEENARIARAHLMRPALDDEVQNAFIELHHYLNLGPNRAQRQQLINNYREDIRDAYRNYVLAA